MTPRRSHRRHAIPVVTVYCDDAIHADEQRVTHRFGKYPPGVFDGIEGWHLLSDFYEDSFDDTGPRQRRRRFIDEVVTVDGRRQYNLKCDRCERRNNPKKVTIPIYWDRLQLVCDYVVATGESSVTLAEFAAIVSRSAGRQR